MTDQDLTIRVPLLAELLIRFKGSDALHSLGIITYEPDVHVVLKDAVGFEHHGR